MPCLCPAIGPSVGALAEVVRLSRTIHRIAPMAPILFPTLCVSLLSVYRIFNSLSQSKISEDWSSKYEFSWHEYVDAVWTLSSDTNRGRNNDRFKIKLHIHWKTRLVFSIRWLLWHAEQHRQQSLNHSGHVALLSELSGSTRVPRVAVHLHDGAKSPHIRRISAQFSQKQF